MGLNSYSRLVLYSWVFVVFFQKSHCNASELTIKFLKTPRVITNRNWANFAFRILVGGYENNCTNCTTNCKLDDHLPSVCETGEVFYAGLKDGNHTCEVCTKGFHGVGCTVYTWTVDTVPPTAYVAAAASFTNAPNVSVNISFSEPCSGQGGFQCASVDSCNLLVYGAGKVIPTTLNTIQPGLIFSLIVSLSPSVQYGRVILVLDINFCTDAAGNKFTRTENSSFFVRFDRRSVFVSLRTHMPERLIQLENETRTVLATNKNKNLELYLYFTEPVLNSSTEISNSIHTSQGSLLPIVSNSLGNRRFGFQVKDISSLAIVTVRVDSDLILSRYGAPVSPVAPVTFLYDSQRPAVKLSTTSNMRTRHKILPMLIRFMKPVFGFNSSHVSVSGGYLQGFRELSRRRVYALDIQADDDMVSINVPENITKDVAGNGNLASNILQVRHYSMPALSLVFSSFATAAFVLTAIVAGLLTISVASLQSIGAYRRRSSSLTSNPARNLFRIACHIQTFALSRWLAVTLPVEYYELARGLQWSIPYFSLPWDIGHIQPAVTVPSSSRTNSHLYSSKVFDLGIFKHVQPQGEYADIATSIYGLPLTPAEYRLFFESQNIPEAEYILNISNGWSDFKKSMFWLAAIGGSLILFHALLLFILKFRKTKSEKQKIYGALILPRFEIFLIILALPCVCEASVALLKGGSASGVIVGILLLGVVLFLLLALLLFLSIGITFGKLLQYKEVHKEGQKSHWYQHIIRVTLGPGKRGQWTWISQSNSVYLTMLGPLFEDLRGPPKYMLSQISVENSLKHGDRIIPSDDETEDAEALFIQKLFGILRIYYTLLESIKRVSLGILAGAYSEDWSSKAPTIILLSLTSFQLFFMVLKKPFIKRKVQLVEIISVSSEVGLFATCFVLLEKTFSSEDETKIGIFMLSLFLVAFFTQMINEWYALYKQTKQLDPAENSFLSGLKAASVGFLLCFIPQKLIKNLYSSFELDNLGDGEPVDPASSGERNGRSSSRNENPWLKQIRDLAQSSFGKETSGTTTTSDPSTSGTRWSGLWSNKRSHSTSLNSSGDTKSKSKGLYKDLEAIFASKKKFNRATSLLLLVITHQQEIQPCFFITLRSTQLSTPVLPIPCPYSLSPLSLPMSTYPYIFLHTGEREMGSMFSSSSKEEIDTALSKVKDIVSSTPVVVFR